MAPFYASIWALIEEKGIKGVLTTRKKAREFFLKNIVAVDGLNQGHNGGRAPVTFAEQRTNLGRRLLRNPTREEPARNPTPSGAGQHERSSSSAVAWIQGNSGWARPEARHYCNYLYS